MKLHSYQFLFEHDGFLTEMTVWVLVNSYQAALEKAREKASRLKWKLRDDLSVWSDGGWIEK